MEDFKIQPGAAMPKWTSGRFQAHFIYTGVAESIFLVFPDGTSMLLDCGDHAAITRLHLAMPVRPGPERLAGDWIARYVERVNPAGRQVDYLVVSHFHADHTGTPKWCSSAPFGDNPGSPGAVPSGAQYYRSGFGLAAERLRFKRAIDRGWPDYDDPVPFVEGPSREYEHMRRIYAWLQKRDGLAVEKFRLGATDQFVPLHDPAACRGFSVFNLCANGRIAMPDGSVRTLFPNGCPAGYNENLMSLGAIYSYGPFRLFMAGDFSGTVAGPEGRAIQAEDILAEAVQPVDVAKISHHGHHSATPALVRALAPRAWVSCVWDQLHLTPDTFALLTDRSLYPGERMILPGCLPDAIRKMPAEARRDVPDAVMKPVHIVLDVAEGGAEYTLAALSAEDEEMRPVATYLFQSGRQGPCCLDGGRENRLAPGESGNHRA